MFPHEIGVGFAIAVDGAWTFRRYFENHFLLFIKPLCTARTYNT